MPVFTIQAPDGRKIKIEAADQATALRGAQEWAAANPAQQAQPAQMPQAQPVLDGARTGTGPAFQSGAMQGMTFGFGDEILAGMMTPIEMAQAGNFDVGAAYNRALGKNRALDTAAQQSDQTAATIGDITGSLVTGGQLAKGGLTLMKGAKPTIASMAGRGAAEGAIYGGAQGFGRGDSLNDRLVQAGIGGATGAILGGATGAAGGAMAQRGVQKSIPEIDQLQAQKNAAYGLADKFGVKASADKVDNLYQKMLTDAGADNISPTRHPKAYSFLSDLENRGGPKTLTQLDQLRQEISRDLISSSDGSERHFGYLFRDALDEFIDNWGGASKIITTARAANTTLRKAEALQEAVEKAQRNAASSGSGGNIDNAVRQQIKAILNNPKRVKPFTNAERDLMEKIVAGKGNLQGFLRLVGKLSPSGNGLMAALGIGATAANPAMAIPVGAGIVAKQLSDNATRGAVNNLTRAVRTGASAMPNVPSAPYPTLYALESQVAPQFLLPNRRTSGSATLP